MIRPWMIIFVYNYKLKVGTQEHILFLQPIYTILQKGAKE